MGQKTGGLGAPISKTRDHPERRADSGVSPVHRQPEGPSGATEPVRHFTV